jgi:hypothetical protein
MAKKHTKRYARSVSASPQPVAAAVTASEAAATKAPRVSRRTVEDSDFAPDYTLIIRDLKRIGILAGSFFVVLLALSFIL